MAFFVFLTPPPCLYVNLSRYLQVRGKSVAFEGLPGERPNRALLQQV